MKTRTRFLILMFLSGMLSACEMFGGGSLTPSSQPAQPSDAASGTEVNQSEGQAEPVDEGGEEGIAVAEDQSPVPEAFTLVVPHPSQGDLAVILALHAQQAAEMDRRPYVEFSAEWCPPCQALEASLSDPLMVEALRGVYLIRLDIDEWEDQLKSSEFRIPGIPLFYELDADGKPTGRAIAGSAWGPDIPRYMAPPLHAFFQGT